MAEPVLRRSPLANQYHVGPFGASLGAVPGVTLRQLSPRLIWSISGAARSPALGRSVAGEAGHRRVTELALPGGLCVVLPVGPERWLILSDEPEGELGGAVLEEFEAPKHFDLSHARLVIEVGGTRAPDLLAKGCPLDLAALAPGCCASTLLGPVQAVLHCARGEANTNVYRVLVPRSYAVSGWHWMLAAAADLGGEVLPAGSVHR